MERGRKMDLVFISVYAEAYYSEEEYYDSFWIKRSSYEKIKDDISDEIYCGELDGKHSETMGSVTVYKIRAQKKSTLQKLMKQCKMVIA